MQRLTFRSALCAVVANFVVGGCLPDTLDETALQEKVNAAQYAKSCASQFDCAIGDCAGDATCEQACLPGTVDGVSAKVEALMTCAKSCVESTCKPANLQGEAMANCQRACVTYRCASDALACGDTSGSGSGKCIDLLGCLDQCPPPSSSETASCAEACADALSPNDFQLAAAYASCQSGAVKANKQPNVACTTELAACYASGISGAGECHEAFGCQTSCVSGGGTESNCLTECFGKLSVAAQSDYLAYLVCADEKKQDWLACKTPLIACAAPAGKLGCKTLFDEFQSCLGKKGTNASAACLVETLHQGSSNAAAPFLDAVACYANQCASQCSSGGPQCNACLTGKCGKQSVACTTQG